jgi:hypothetical protein
MTGGKTELPPQAEINEAKTKVELNAKNDLNMLTIMRF